MLCIIPGEKKRIWGQQGFLRYLARLPEVVSRLPDTGFSKKLVLNKVLPCCLLLLVGINQRAVKT